MATRQNDVVDREQLHALWDRVERDLREAVALLESEHQLSSLQTVEEFLDHNELGLALEVLVDDLMERELTPSPAAFRHLERAASAMELTGDDRWLDFAERASDA